MSLDILNSINNIPCECGKDHSFSADVIIGEGTIQTLPEKIKKFEGKKVFLLADAITYKVAGETAVSILEESGISVSK